ILRDIETLRVLATVEADAHAVGDLATLIDDGADNGAALADGHIGQDHRTLHARALVHVHIGEHQRLAHHGTRDDAAARHHGVDSHAAAPALTEDELGRRLVQLIGPGGPFLIVDVEPGAHMHQLHI